MNLKSSLHVTVRLLFVTSASALLSNCGAGGTSSPSSSSSSSDWAQQAYVKASNADASDSFGVQVAIDGDTLVVGSSGEDSNEQTITNAATASSNNSAINSGAVYVYKRSGTSWVQQAYLKAPNAEADDQFGISVAISGDTIVVGATGEDSNQQSITNGTSASSDNSASQSGAAYVFTRSGTTWTQQAYLKASNAETLDFFGTAVAISGDIISVSAIGEDSNQQTITNGTSSSSDNSASNAGAVYVYKRTGTNWAQEAYIKASNADAGDSFGASLSLDADTLVVGATNEASNLTTITNGTGASTNNSSPGSGAAYVYRRTGSNWAQEAYIKASNSETSDKFGNSVSLSGDTLVVSAPLEDSSQTTITNSTTSASDNSSINSGAVYVYKRSGTAWAQEAYIKGANSDAFDQFGESVSIEGDSLIVGAKSEDSNDTSITNAATASANNSAVDSGAAYIYKRTGTTWAQQAFLKASNAEAFDHFGSSVKISGATVAVGADAESSNQTTITNGTISSSDDSASGAGAAYVYLKN